MFGLWCKFYKDNHVLQATVIIITDNTLSRTDKVFHSVSQACVEFDLSSPIWLDSNIREFQRHNKTRFIQDNFVEEISFDFLEIDIIEE